MKKILNREIYKIKKIAKKSSILYYIVTWMKEIRNPELRNLHISIEKDPRWIYIDTLGKKNEGCLIGRVGTCHPANGFFAIMRTLLDQLYTCDQFGITPCAEFSQDCLYFDKDITETLNPFEYYFQPFNNIAVNELYQSQSVVLNPKGSLFSERFADPARPLYDPTELQIEEYAKIWKKYIQLKHELQEQFNEEIRCLLGNYKTIGVHIRGGDFKKNFNGHPVVVSPQLFCKEVKKLLNETDNERIFLATDDWNALELFKRAFGEKVVFFKDVIRSQDDQANFLQNVNRSKDKYLKGREVLRDVMALATCSSFVGGMSQVSMFARIIKKSKNEVFENFIFCSNGVNYNNNVATIEWDKSHKG